MTTIVIVRMRIDPATRAYAARRRAEGRTTKEFMRSLNRYITRQLFRSLAAPTPSRALDTYRSIPGCPETPNFGKVGVVLGNTSKR